MPLTWGLQGLKGLTRLFLPVNVILLFFLRKRAVRQLLNIYAPKSLNAIFKQILWIRCQQLLFQRNVAKKLSAWKQFFCLTLMITSTIVNKSFQRVLFQDFSHSDNLTFLLVFTIHWIMFSSVWNMLIQLKIIVGSRLLRTAQRSSRRIHQHHRKSFCKRPPLGRLLKIAGHHYLLEE